VTFTRTGDVDVGSVADPADQQSRVLSPAEALHGRYSMLRTFSSASKASPLQSLASVTTDCLRTGDRCMSYFHGGTGGDIPLVFSAGKWIWDVSGDGLCPSREATQVKETAQFPMPEPPQNPISQFSGQGHHQQSAPCAIEADFDQKFTRIGD
jgi:serine/threonine-protein kinase